MIWRKRALKNFSAFQAAEQLMPEKSKFRHYFKFILLVLAFSSLILAWANPQIGTKQEKVKRKGVDVIIALDVSKSMLAEDIKPSRIEQAKQFVSRLIDELKMDRIGLIIFAGNAYLQMPITTDHAAAKLFLKSINTNLVPTQGTAIGDAIRLGIESFEGDEKKFKSIVIISDGENHEGEAIEATEEASEQGIIIHTVGVGSQKGAPIPVYRNNVQTDYLRDKSGNIVLSKLDENMLRQIAVKGDGEYLNLKSGSETLNALTSAIAAMEKREFEENVFTDYEDQFQYFLAFALFLLIVEILIAERKSKWSRKLNLFKEEAQ
ncbi:MAG: VWA domain-containing protein [Chitinophagales bacterium]